MEKRAASVRGGAPKIGRIKFIYNVCLYIHYKCIKKMTPPYWEPIPQVRSLCGRPAVPWALPLSRPQVLVHIYIPRNRTPRGSSGPQQVLHGSRGPLFILPTPLGCPRFSHRGGGLFRIPRAPWISGWQRPAGCNDASHSAEGVWVFASPFVSLLQHRLALLSRPFLTFFVDSGSLTSGWIVLPPAQAVSFCLPEGRRRGFSVEPPLGKGFKDKPLRTAGSGGGFSQPLLTLWIISDL